MIDRTFFQNVYRAKTLSRPGFVQTGFILVGTLITSAALISFALLLGHYASADGPIEVTYAPICQNNNVPVILNWSPNPDQNTIWIYVDDKLQTQGLEPNQSSTNLSVPPGKSLKFNVGHFDLSKPNDFIGYNYAESISPACPGQTQPTPTPPSQPSPVSDFLPPNGLTENQFCEPNPNDKPTIVAFTWNASPGAKSYRVYIEDKASQDPSKNLLPGQLVKGTGDTWLDFPGDGNIQTWFVRAYATEDGNDNGPIADSSRKNFNTRTDCKNLQPPAVPQGLGVRASCSSLGQNTLTLFWNAADGATGYRLVVMGDSGQLSERDVPGTAVEIPPPTHDIKYSWKVKAYKDFQGQRLESAYTDTREITPQIIDCPKPTPTPTPQPSPTPSPIFKSPPCYPPGDKYGYGDVDADGFVTNADAEAMRPFLLQTPSTPAQIRADVDGGKIVDIYDVAKIGGYISGQQPTFPVCSPVSPTPTPTPTSTPQPTSSPQPTASPQPTSSPSQSPVSSTAPECKPPSAFTLNSPESESSSTQPTFKWGKSEGAIRYFLQLSDDNFITYWDVPVSTNSTQNDEGGTVIYQPWPGSWGTSHASGKPAPTGLIDQQIYQWRVNAINECINTQQNTQGTYLSESRKVIYKKPVGPRSIEPATVNHVDQNAQKANGFEGVDVTFTWKTSPNSTDQDQQWLYLKFKEGGEPNHSNSVNLGPYDTRVMATAIPGDDASPGLLEEREYVWTIDTINPTINYQSSLAKPDSFKTIKREVTQPEASPTPKPGEEICANNVDDNNNAQIDENCPPQKPVLTQPEPDFAYGAGSTAVFSWKNSGQVDYSWIDVSQSSNFDKWWGCQTTNTNTTLAECDWLAFKQSPAGTDLDTVQVPNSFPNGQYFWRVTAVNDFGKAQSQVQKFTVGQPLPSPSVSPSPSPSPKPSPSPSPTPTPPPLSPTPSPQASPSNPESDIDITYIERTPKFDYDSVKKWPSQGETTTFIAHIKNTGGQSTGPFAYKWQVDNSEIKNGIHSSINPQEVSTESIQWSWQNGNHTVKFKTDPDNSITEKSEANNEIEIRTNALAVGFWVEKSVYDFFNSNQNKLSVDSNSWEDWAQRQINTWNNLFASSTYPNIPHGVIDKVRIDKITVVKDGALPLNGGLATNHPDTRDKTVDLMWGFPANLLNSELYKNNGQVKLDLNDNNAFYLEYSLIHELSHARYLIDLYAWNLNPHPGMDDVKITKSDNTRLIPPSTPKIYECEGGQMGCASPPGRNRLYSEYDVLALNRIAGQRAKCGNYNFPCNGGEYTLDIPTNNIIKVVDINNSPVANAQVYVYQSQKDPVESLDFYDKLIDNTPDITCTTGQEGSCSIGAKPFGIMLNGWDGMFQGISVIKIVKNNQESFRWLYLSEANMAFWKNGSSQAIFTVNSDFSPTGASLGIKIQAQSQPLPENDFYSYYSYIESLVKGYFND